MDERKPMLPGVNITVYGEPQGKGRARTATVPDGRGGCRMVSGKNGKRRPMLIHHTPKKTRSYEQSLRFEAIRAMGTGKPFSGPIRLNLIMVMSIPASWPVWKKDLARSGMIFPTGKPDADNVEKAVKDALNKVVWGDDSQVVAGEKAQIYQCDQYPDPGIHAAVSTMPGYPSQITKKSELDHVE